ncbi:hypothetical protein VDGD_20691 [Verticillium dahliae]|nr:hypothetical protein VDGD_20691 [Verticillium dahliae]
MTVATVHPGQQRSSCEGCRKQKTRCQRLQPGDTRCARCMMHNIDCVAGRQKRIGRPRRAAERQTDLAQATTETRQPHPRPPQSSPQQASNQTRSSFAPSPPSQGSSPGHIYGSAGLNSGRNNLSSLGVEGIADPSPESLPDVPFGPEGNELTHADTILHAVTTLSLMNMGLYGRTQVVETYKDVMTLDLMIYQRGPLYINNITLAQFMLLTSQEFVAVLNALQTEMGRRKLQRLLAATSAPTHFIATSANELPITISLLITSILRLLLDLYDLWNILACARVTKLGEEPAAPCPGPTTGVWQLVDACSQGLLFTQIIYQMLEQMEKLLGITWGADHGDGLLSPRQMHTLSHEISGELGSGITRTEAVKSGLRKTAFDIQKIITHRLH